MHGLLGLVTLLPLALAKPAFHQRQDTSLCGVQGTATGTLFGSAPTITTLAQCGGNCAAITACQSYAISQTEGCFYYQNRVEGNYIENASSTFLLYDKYYCAYEDSSSTTTAATPTPTPISACEVNGVAGYDKGSPLAYWYTEDPTTAALTGCTDLCKSKADCNSLAVGNGACLLYNAPLVNNINPVETSPYIFYDLACLISSSSSSAVASATPTAA